MYGAWPLVGGVPDTKAGGGKVSVGKPSSTPCMTAVHVRVG